MRNKIIALMAWTIVVLEVPRSVMAVNLPEDKVNHFGVAAASQTLCSSVGKSVTHSKWGAIVYCFVGINALGAAKEALDPYMGSQREEKDIFANLAGSGISAISLSIAF